jgi:hypothetical protein
MRHRRRRTIGRHLVLAAVLAAGPAVSAVGSQAAEGAGALPGQPARPHHPAPSHFTRGRVDNPWFPLKPGTRYTYRGVEGNAHTRDVMIATYRTRKIDGVVCRIVFDRVWSNGRLEERTRDFYAQTTSGTVWYFGERTATLDRQGNVKSRDGSFTSGVDGAEAGIFMTPHPRVGPSHYQEYYPGQALDIYTVVRRDATVTVPLVHSAHALLTREVTPLEPGVVDHKYYVRDIGSVREQTVKGGRETLWLVGLTHVPRR